MFNYSITNIRFEVFIHKVDGLNDDTKMETQRDIHQRATDDMIEADLEQEVGWFVDLVQTETMETQ